MWTTLELTLSYLVLTNFKASFLKLQHIYRDICFIFFIYMYARIKMPRNLKNSIQIWAIEETVLFFISSPVWPCHDVRLLGLVLQDRQTDIPPLLPPWERLSVRKS